MSNETIQTFREGVELDPSLPSTFSADGADEVRVYVDGALALTARYRRIGEAFAWAAEDSPGDPWLSLHELLEHRGYTPPAWWC